MGEGMVEVENEKVREKIKDARKKDQRGETVAGDGDRGGEQQELIESYSLLSIQLHDSTCSLIFFNPLLCEYYFFSTQLRSCYDYCRTVRLTENLEPRHYVSGSAINGSVMANTEESSSQRYYYPTHVPSILNQMQAPTDTQYLNCPHHFIR